MIDITCVGTLELYDNYYSPTAVQTIDKNRLMSFMLVCESAPETPDPHGTWGVNPLSIVRGINTPEIYLSEASDE